MLIQKGPIIIRLCNYGDKMSASNEYKDVVDIDFERYVNSVWKELEGFFHVLVHGDVQFVSSLDGAHRIIWIFKDWVENNGGWKDIQEARSTNREAAIHRWIHLGAKTYLEDQNLDMSCEANHGVGQEDFKISRGSDKTIIEVKLSSNADCKHGYEIQLPRYAESEHTENMIFVLVKVDSRNWNFNNTGKSPMVVVIDARPQKSASLI